MIIRRIEATGGLESVIVLRMLAAHAVPGLEVVDEPAGRYERVIEGPEGPYLMSIVIDDRGVQIASADLSPAEQARTDVLVRRWFDLDSDLGPVNRRLSADPLLAPMVAARPRLRVLGHPIPFEAAIGTVLGQQVSVAAARTFAGRLVAAYGMSGPGRLMMFPRPEVLRDADPEELRAVVGLTGSRSRTVQAVAAAFADRGTLLPLSRSELLALPGIGPWTADYLAVTSGDRDAFTPGDLVLRRALGGVDARAASARAERWRPFRAYALFHLWVASAYLRPA